MIDCDPVEGLLPLTMLTAVIAFALGVFFGPVIKPMLRPLLVEIIKLALVTAEEMKRLSLQVKEDIEDAAAEANAQRATAQQAAAGPNSPTSPPASSIGSNPSSTASPPA